MERGAGDRVLELVASVPAEVGQLVAVAAELGRGVRDLPEGDARWRRVLEELSCDVQVHVAACAGRVGDAGALARVDVEAVGHTFEHLRAVQEARLAGGPVPFASISGCGCAAGAWLRPWDEPPADNRAARGSRSGVRRGRSVAGWWWGVLGAVGVLGLVAVMSVVAVALGPPWQHVLVAGVAGVLVSGVLGLRHGAGGRSEERTW